MHHSSMCLVITQTFFELNDYYMVNLGVYNPMLHVRAKLYFVHHISQHTQCEKVIQLNSLHQDIETIFL